MKIFKDNAGRSWTLCINVDSIRRVKSMIDVNLLEALDGKLIEKLLSDPMLLCDVVYALCKTDADIAKISDADFGKSMGGDAIDNATAALLEELVDFFPLRRRQILTKALNKIREVETRGIAMAEKNLEAVNIESILASASESSGKSPEY